MCWNCTTVCLECSMLCKKGRFCISCASIWIQNVQSFLCFHSNSSWQIPSNFPFSSVFHFQKSSTTLSLSHNGVMAIKCENAKSRLAAFMWEILALERFLENARISNSWVQPWPTLNSSLSLVIFCIFSIIQRSYAYSFFGISEHRPSAINVKDFFFHSQLPLSRCCWSLLCVDEIQLFFYNNSSKKRIESPASRFHSSGRKLQESKRISNFFPLCSPYRSLETKLHFFLCAMWISTYEAWSPFVLLSTNFNSLSTVSLLVRHHRRMCRENVDFVFHICFSPD